jgi:tetratricopeptide (TPR) repeat protein
MDSQPHAHPDPATLTSFGKGELSRWESRDIVHHLLTGCETCNASTYGFLPSGSADAVHARAFDYGDAFSEASVRIAERAAAAVRERDEAAVLLPVLLALSLERQMSLVAEDSRYRTWALCERLLDVARENGFQDPARALELARLGVQMADRIDRAVYGEERVHDLSARAWVVLANAERIRSDFRSAEKSFARAERLLKAGTGDPIELATFLLLKASLRGNQQRFREAFRLLDRTVAIARRSGDRELWGKALITRGFLLGLANDLEAAIRLLSEGIELVDGDTDPRLRVAAHHNLTLYLTESGRYEEAMRLLERTRPLYQELGDRMNLLRLQWLEGKIATSLGHLDEAELLLQEVRRELIEREIGLDSALLSLDLARIYARQRRGAEMRKLAEEMLPIFQSRDVHREAIAALLVFQKAAEMERVTLGLVQELSEYLKECRVPSGFRFRESA